MIDRVRLHRPNQADVVRNRGGVGQHLAQFHAALPVLLEFESRTQERGIWINERGPISCNNSAGGNLPSRLVSSGFGSNNSRWLGAPALNR